MYFRIMGKLNARRNAITTENEKGFTLIELLVVVIIIGILAAIAIPVYLGVQNNAKNSATQSDVSNLKTAVVSVQTNKGTLPGTSTNWTSVPASPAAGSSDPDWAAAGMTLSSNTTRLYYQYISATSFCVAGYSSANTAYYATESGGVTGTKPSQCTAVTGS